LGSYGDPAAVPIETLEPILAVAAGHTGYTHQWAKTIGLAYRDICMASVDTTEQADLALSHGWRYFYASPDTHAKRKGEINCPASIEAGQKTQCNNCTLCFGSGDGPGKGSRRTPTVFIVIHGNKAQKSIYYNRTAQALAVV